MADSAHPGNSHYDNTTNMAETGAASLQQFLTRSQSIRTQLQALDTEISSIDGLAQRSNDNVLTSERGVSFHAAISDLQNRSQTIFNELNVLKSDVEKTPEPERATKLAHFNTSLKMAKAQLHKLVNAERRARDSYREQIERQYRIANPQATDEEVRSAGQADWSQEGVFRQALGQANFGQAQTVLSTIRSRQEDLSRLEQSMGELAQLFNQMNTLVVQQDVAVQQMPQQTEDAVHNMEGGNKELDQALVHARHTRRLKWYCVGVTALIIILAVALGVGLGVGLKKT